MGWMVGRGKTFGVVLLFFGDGCSGGLVGCVFCRQVGEIVVAGRLDDFSEFGRG